MFKSWTFLENSSKHFFHKSFKVLEKFWDQVNFLGLELEYANYKFPYAFLRTQTLTLRGLRSSRQITA